MVTAEEIVRELIPNVSVLQLATTLNDEPWACNLHFYSDENLNLYWLSTEDRWHSQQIARNPSVAATVLLHLNSAEEDYVIGVTLAGKAECLGAHADETIVSGYQLKQNTSDKFLAEVAAGSNPHKWYCLKPTKVVLFDTKHFPEDSRQELESHA